MNERLRRNAKEFIDELEFIKLERIKRGLDEDKISDARLTRGIVKIPEWKFLKEKLIKLPRKKDEKNIFSDMNRRGFLKQLVFMMILTLIIGLLIAGYFAYSLFVPVAQKTTNQVTNIIVSSTNTTNNNLSVAATTAGSMVLGVNASLEELSYVLVITLIFGFIIMCFGIRMYPFLIYFWIILVVVLLLISIYISYSYNSISTQNNYVGSAVTSWSANNFMLSNLPVLILFAGIVGGIIMFAISGKQPEEEARGGYS